MRSTTDATLMEAVRESARPLTGSARDYDALMDVVGDARFALLGEASHGTHEFYRERAEITKRLITEDEEAIDLKTAHLRFDVGLLSERLVAATDWLMQRSETHLPVGYFGASTGAGAALVAAAERPDVVRAVVSRGGRPDMAGPALARVQAPTLLIVGEADFLVVRLNQEALAKLTCEKRLVIVPGATHLFVEPGALDEVAHLAREWFERYLTLAEARVTGPGAP